MSGEIYRIAKRAVNAYINTGSIPDYVAKQVEQDLLKAGWVKLPDTSPARDGRYES